MPSGRSSGTRRFMPFQKTRTPCPGPDHLDLKNAQDKLRSLRKQDRWTNRQYASALSHLAAHTLTSGEYAEGLDLLRRTDEADPTLSSSDAGAPLLNLSAALEYAYGRKLEAESDYVKASAYYASATARWTDLGIAHRSLEGLVRVDTCVERGGLNATLRVFPTISNVASDLSTFARGEPEFIIQEICRHACIELNNDPPTTGLLTGLHQVAKGRDFRAAVSEAGPVPPDKGERLLLKLIADASSATPPPREDLPRSLQGELPMDFISGRAKLCSRRTRLPIRLSGFNARSSSIISGACAGEYTHERIHMCGSSRCKATCRPTPS